jgi:hypothetical protein
VWTGGSTSVHDHCQDVSVATLADRDAHTVARIGKQGDIDLGGGVLVWGTRATACDDAGTTTIPAGVGLIDLATGATRQVSSDAATQVAIAGTTVAWVASVPNENGGENDTLYVRVGDDAPVEVGSWAIPVGRVADLQVAGNQVTWVIEWEYGTGRDVYRATIGNASERIAAFGGDRRAIAVAGDVFATVTDGGDVVVSEGDSTPRLIGTGAQPVVATDGTFVFWSVVQTGSVAIEGYDLRTDSRFTAWQVASDADAGRISSMSANHGALTWARIGYDMYKTAIHAAPLTAVLPSAYRPDPGQNGESTWYTESGHSLSNGFRDYWNANGGLPVFGYPLTDEFTELSGDTGDEYTVQYLERQRFEWHPENVGTPYEVLLGRLGAELLDQQGRSWELFPKADPGAPYFVAETGHAIAPEFYDYWASHGLDFGDERVTYRESLALFGYPISEPMMETNADGDTVLTQYFERAVFEYHPDIAEPYTVLLRRLGAEMLTARGWS